MQPSADDGPCKIRGRARVGLVADNMTKGLSQSTAAALEKQGYHCKDEATELESSQDDVAQQGLQALGCHLWVGDGSLLMRVASQSQMLLLHHLMAATTAETIDGIGSS